MSGDKPEFIYLDNAATTRTLPEAVSVMLPFFTETYGNASAVYEAGQLCRSAVMRSRKTIADLIGADRDEIYFTSGGSEADNWALKGVFELALDKGREKPPHIITTAIEHHAVLHTCEWLQKMGADVTFIQPDKEGFINPEDVERAIRKETVLISVMLANNEIGTIEPIARIGQIAHDHGILFHTDAVQAYGQIPVSVRDMYIDLLSASSHKLYGPKGVGFLYIRRGIQLPALIHGGGQERGKRAGTENVPGIVGFAKAAEAAGGQMEDRMKQERRLRSQLIRQVMDRIPGTLLNGPAAAENERFPELRRLPGNANFCFEGVDGEALLALLDMQGICASSGSACSAGSLDPSHVLLAVGRNHAQARSSVRFSIGAFNTEEEITQTARILEQDVRKLRAYT